MRSEYKRNCDIGPGGIKCGDCRLCKGRVSKRQTQRILNRRFRRAAGRSIREQLAEVE